MKTQNKIPLQERFTFNKLEFSAVTGRSLELIDKWIAEGIPCTKESGKYTFEKVTALKWIQERALRREGLVRRAVVYDDVFPGIELS